MIHRDDLPDTPDWRPDHQHHGECVNCRGSERFCGLNIEWNQARCCTGCNHDDLRAVLGWNGDQA